MLKLKIADLFRKKIKIQLSQKIWITSIEVEAAGLEIQMIKLFRFSFSLFFDFQAQKAFKINLALFNVVFELSLDYDHQEI